MARPLADPELRRKIAVAVFTLVAEHGIDGVRMRAASLATGLSTGTLNYHFENKRGLVRFALQYAYAAPPDWSEHQGDTSSALARLFRRYVLDREEVRTWWRFFCAVTAHAGHDAFFRKCQTDTQEKLVAFFGDVLRAGQRRGEVPRALDADVEAEHAVALAHGVALRQLTSPGRPGIALAKRILEAEIRRLCVSRTSVRL